MSKRLKILFLTNRSPFPIKDGQSRRTYHILRCLAENHDVHLFSLYETIEEIDPNNIQHLETLCNCVEMHPAPSKKITFPMILRLSRSIISKDPYTIWRHYSRLYLKKICNKININQYDLVHCDILPLAYTVRTLKTPIRTITDHDVSYLKSLRMAKHCKNPLLRLFLYLEAYKVRRLEGQLFENIDISIVVSEVDKEHLKKLCPKGRFEVIENGVDTDEFKPVPTKVYSNTLLWIGGFEHYSNKEAMHYFLKDIYPLVKKNVPDVQIQLVGGNVPDRFREMAMIDRSMKILGYVDDVIPFLNRAKAFIVPILSGSGTRLKILEAMAAGKAIVTTSMGCEGIEAQNNDYYLVADTPAKFARATIEVLNNDDLRLRLGRNARELAKKKYDWTIICNKLNRIYKEVVKRNANRVC